MAGNVLGSMGVMTTPSDNAHQNPTDASAGPAGVSDIARKYQLPRNVLMALEERGEDPEKKAAEIAGALSQGAKIEDVVPYAALVRAGDIADEIEGVEPEGGLGKAFGAGVDTVQQALGSAVEGAGRSLGIEGVENYGATVAENNAAEAQSRSRALTRMDDVDGLGSGASFVGETLAQQVPQFGTSLGPVAAGAGIGSMVAPGPGTAAGALAGGAVALAANIAQMYGFNRERQKEEGATDVNEAAAFGTAIPQAGLDLVADAAILTPFGGPTKALQGGNMAARIMKGAGLGVVTEAPTEAAQQAMERAQAGLDVTGPDARDEYIESAVAGGIVGGVLGGGRGALSRRVDPEPVVDAPQEEILSLPPSTIFQGQDLPPDDGSVGGEGATDVSNAPVEDAEVAPSVENLPVADGPPREGVSDLATSAIPDAPTMPRDDPKADLSSLTLEEAERRLENINKRLRRMRRPSRKVRDTQLQLQEIVEEKRAGEDGVLEQPVDTPVDTPVQAVDTPVQVTIEPIREKAAVLRGVSKDKAPQVGNISLKWDEKEGGFIFSRKHVDKVQAAVDAMADRTPADTPAPVAEAAEETAPDPTPAQAEAENYKTGKAKWRGLNLSVENKKGSVRSKKTPDGKTEWSVTMPAHYGRILGTVGADGDHVDFYMGDDEASEAVFVVDQIEPETGKFDEHKVMLGFTDEESARAAYEAGFSDGSGKSRLGAVKFYSASEFDEQIKNPDRWKGPLVYDKAQAKPASKDKVDQEPVKKEEQVKSGYGGYVTKSEYDRTAADREAIKNLKNGMRVTHTSNAFDPPREMPGKVKYLDRKGYQATVEVERDDGGVYTIGASKLTIIPDAQAQSSKAEGSVGKDDASIIPTEKPASKPALSSAADRPMKDLSKLDYEGFDDKTREDGQNSPGKREGRSETGRWARATVKALKVAGFTPALNAKGKPMKEVSFGYAMRHEPDETKINLTAPSDIQLFVNMAATSMTRDGGVSILVQFTGEPQKKGQSRPFLGSNRWLDQKMKPSEAAAEIVKMAEGAAAAEQRAKRAADQKSASEKATDVAGEDDASISEAPADTVPPPSEQGADTVPNTDEPPTKTGLLSGLSEEKQARAAELKAKLAAKVRNQASSGLDPEYITLGGELVALYIEGGARKFGQMLRDFADTTGLSMKEAQAPMRAAYNHVRDDMDLAGQDVSEMDDAATVMAEVRAALSEESNLSQNEGIDDMPTNKSSDEVINERDVDGTDTKNDPAGVEGSEPEVDADASGSERGDERGDIGSGESDTDSSGAGPDVAGGVVGDGPERSGDETAQPKGVSPGNFVIPEGFGLGSGTPSEKIADNMAAIKLVKQLQAENRHPTKAEQSVLAKYVGWGGLKRVFDPKETGKTSQWGRTQAELRDLLTPDQYRAAGYSTAHAHYTSPDVVAAMWEAMRGFGFEAGRALEPTVGTGNFIGLQPDSMAQGTEWFAAELDDLTGAIAERLYPDATVFAGKGFEDAPFRPGTIDVAIGNPPFGSEILKSDLHPEIPPLSVHNYIIAKTGLLLRPGGIMGMVVTSRFLDTPNPQARSYLKEHFNFMGAVRLPNTAFKANAGTEVTTDVVWFQKRRDGDAQGDQTWLETGVKRDDVPMNGYFAANPEMMLGQPSMKGTMYGTDPEFTLSDDGRNLPDAMSEAFAKIEGSLPGREKQLEDAVVAGKTTSDLAIGESLLSDEGKVMMRLDDNAEGAVVVEVTKDSPWGPIAQELIEARNAIASAAQAIQKESAEDAQAAIQIALGAIGDTGAIGQDGSVKKSTPTGMGKQAHEALRAIVEGLSDEQPFFGPDQKKAMRALKEAVGEKTIGAKKLAALRGMLGLRKDTISLLAAEMRNDPKMDAKRKKLRRDYRAFVKKHGFVNNPANDSLVGGLPGAEAALEAKYKKANKKQGREASAEEAAILSKRINTPYERAKKADSAQDGIHISLRERGRLDMAFIASLTGQDVSSVIDDLTSGEKPMAFFDPKRDQYAIADEYLSGNLAEKIREARENGALENVSHLEAAMPEDKTAEQITPSIRSLWMPPEVFKDFLKELGAATPKVSINMKSAMVDIQAAGKASDFGEMFQTERKSVFEIFDSAIKGKSITVYDTVDRGKRVKNERATQDANAAAERMSAEFQKWAYMNDERKNDIVDAFNEKMNVVVPRKFDGVSYLTQVGANPEIQLRNSQKNGAWRMMLSDSTLLHHVVGAGKTFTAITAIMERKRLGLSKKSLVSVPNHIVSQWARDFYALYPGANILAATEKDFQLSNRRKLLARIATGDYDAVIIGHSALRYIENSREDTEKLMQEQLSDLEIALDEAKRSGASRATVSQTQSRVKKYRDKMKKLLETLEGDKMGFDFATMGVDNLVIDEAQEFKNLEYATSSDRLVGMNNPDGSQRALDLYIKTRGIKERSGAVGFLTGTPVSNSLVEVYTVMKYMIPDTMREMNLMQYDAWASSFVASKIRFEYTAAQKLKERNVLAGLTNLGPLSDMYRSFSDIVMRPDVERMYTEQIEAENKENGTNKPTRFPTPIVKGGQRRLISLPSSPAQDEFTDYLVMRMGGIQENKSDKEYAKKDNALWVLSDARKASIDIRTVDPEGQRHEHSKVVSAGNNILRLAKKWEKQRGAQLVFADSSVPTKNASKSIKASLKVALGKAGLSSADAKIRMDRDERLEKPWSKQWGEAVEAIEARFESGDLTGQQQEAIEEWMNGEAASDGAAAAFTADTGFSFYDDLKAYLVEEGMDPSEVAFIHDYSTSDAKAGLFEMVNEGKVRVLIGSTFKMGAGTNAQERLVALHHIDAPWRPSDMEQREGRIVRQGNKLQEADPEGFEVEINAYTTEKTSDVVLWQVLERKAAGIEQFLNASADTLIEDDASDADSYAAFMAQSTGNPVFLKKMETEKAVRDKESEQSSMRMVVGEARSFMASFDDRIERENRRINDFKGVNFDAYPNAGARWQEFKSEVRAYDAAKLAHKEETEVVRDRNRKLPKGTKKEKLPTFDVGVPNLFDGELDAYLNRIKDAITEAEREGASSSIKIGKGSLQVVRGETNLDDVHSYSVEFKVDGQGYVDGLMRHSAIAKNPFSSRSLLSSLMPENVEDTIRFLSGSAERRIERMTQSKPDMERKSAIKIDESELKALKRDLAKYKGMVRVAEVRNAQDRIGKVNRFAVMDKNERDLNLKSGEDAPLLPESGESFTFENGGNTYTSDLGALDKTMREEGRSVTTYWFEATDQDGTQALLHAAKVVEKDGPPGGAIELLDVYDTSEVYAEAAEMRGQVTDPEMTTEDHEIIADEISKSGLAGKVSARVVDGLVSTITGKSIKGRFSSKDGIDVAKGRDAKGAMRHEIIHALRSEALWGKPYGLFTKEEWQGLVRVARSEKGIKEAAQRDYADQPASVQAEEMVAELYRIKAAAKDARGPVGRIFEKVASLLVALGNSLRGRGFQSAALTMDKVRGGMIGGRGGNPPPSGGRSIQTSEMRAPEGSVRAKFKGLVGSGHWKDPRGFMSNKLSDAMAGNGDYSLLALAPGRPLFTELGKRINGAKAYLTHKEDMDQVRNEWHARADGVSQKWMGLRNENPRANDEFMDLMHRSTLAQTDPTQEYDGSDANLAKKQVSEKGRHAPDWAHRKVAQEAQRQKTHAILKRMFDALPPEFQKMYSEVREEYNAMGDAFEEAVLENIKHSMRVALKRAEKEHKKAMRKIDDDGLTGVEREEAKADADETLMKAKQRNKQGAASKVKSLRAQFEGNRLKGPYFPLARFGQFFVTVRDESGEVTSFSQFESEAEQMAHVSNMEKVQTNRVTHGLMNRKGALRDQVNPTFVADVEGMLADADASPDLMDAIWQRWLETMPDQSIRTSKIHRKGRAGFSEDAFRAFGKHMFHGSHQLARLRYGVLLEESLDDARDEARAADNPNRATAVVNEMERRHEFTMNPTGSSAVASVSSLAFLWYLGASPAAAMVNLSQTTIVGTPIMAAKFGKAGVSGALKALAKASMDFGKGKGFAEDSDGLSKDEKNAMREAYRRGTVDKTQAHDLASVAETGIEYNAVREKWMRKIGWMFHNAERMNREVTFLANYRMARDAGLNHKDAIDLGADLTWKIHFDYQNTARPRFMQSDLGKILTTFRQFTVNMIYRMFRDMHQSLNGATQEERREARAQLVGITLSMMAHAGIKGTWGYGLIMGMLALFSPGDSDDLEDWMQDALLMEGDDPGTAAWNFAMGMALNGAPGHIVGANLTERIGMPNLWFRGAGRELEGRDLYAHYVAEMLGPVYGIGEGIVRGTFAIADGEVMRGAESMIPKFIRDPLKTGRYAAEGVQTWNGDPIVEDPNPWELILQANGFTPSRVAERYDINNRLKNRERKVLDERKSLHRAAGDAIKSGEAISPKVMMQIRDFNTRFPEYPITGKSIRQSYKSRARASANNEFGIQLNRRLNERLRGEVAQPFYN